MIAAFLLSPFGGNEMQEELCTACAEQDELATLDAMAQADLVKRGEVSAREMVEAAIRRIERINPQINAVVECYFDKALVRADSAELQGPLRGVPVLIKDVGIAGEANFLGSELLARLDMRSSETDEFVRRTERAGMIIVGRTNVPELMSAPTTESRLHGAALNPWDVSRSTGGSSGGSAAAVAALLTAAAQASDGGGSTRIPAAANGVVGLKTSRGRISQSPSSADWVDITSTKGWHTRSVRDTAVLLDCVAGVGFADITCAPAPSRPYLEEIGADPGKLRIGLMRKLPGNSAPLDAEAILAVERAADLLAQMGHNVEEANPQPLNSAEHFELIMNYWPIKVAQRLGEAQRRLGRDIREDELEPVTWRMLKSARERDLVGFGVTLGKIHDYTRRTLEWYRSGFDLLLTPMLGCFAPKLGELGVPGGSQGLLWGGFAPMVNLTGQPAITLPLHRTAEGMPLGVQLVADVWREDLLIRVAAQLEVACPWQKYLPPVHA